MSVNYRPVSHVIFDLDGTLIDSESYYYCAVNDLLQEYGKQYDWEVRSRTLGLFITKSAPIIIEFCQLPLTPDQFVEKVLLRFRSYVLGEIDGKGVKMLPGAMRLIEHFKATGVPMAICTGSMKQTYDYKIKPFGDMFSSDKYFHHVVIGAADVDVKQNKPHPDPYRVCIERFGDTNLKPGNVLAFEDSPTGMYSALAADCQCVLVPDPQLDLAKLHSQPTQVIPSLMDFRPELFGLPPFEDNL